MDQAAGGGGDWPKVTSLGWASVPLCTTSTHTCSCQLEAALERVLGDPGNFIGNIGITALQVGRWSSVLVLVNFWLILWGS